MLEPIAISLLLAKGIMSGADCPTTPPDSPRTKREIARPLILKCATDNLDEDDDEKGEREKKGKCKCGDRK